MTQTIVVYIIVALAAFYIGRLFYRKFQAARKPENNGACGCTGCEKSATCTDAMQDQCIDTCDR